VEPERAKQRALEEREKAASAQSDFARAMHLQLAEQFDRRARWPLRKNYQATGSSP
jgi:hypothetical protein